MNPTVSVVIPLHNKEKYIVQTINSVLKQSVSSIEVIVVENNSTDEGPLLVQEIGKSDARVCYFDASTIVFGPSAARNYGIMQANGDWVLFLDADDLIDQHYIEKMLLTAEGNPSSMVIAAPWKSFSEAQGSNAPLLKVNYPMGYQASGEKITDSAVGFTCWAVHAAITKRNWLKDARVWPVELDRYLAEDTSFWFRVVSEASVAYCSYPGAIYREHTVGCRSNYKSDKWFEGCHHAIKSNLAFIESSGASPTAGQKSTLVRVYSDLYVKSKLAGDTVVAQKSLKEAQQWLVSICAEGERLALPIHMRKLLGIPCFEYIRSIVNVFKRNSGE